MTSKSDTKQAPTPGPILCNSETLLGCPVKAELLAALSAAKGYLTNAMIDLQTGAPKKTALDTINGGLRMIDAAQSKSRGEG